MSPPAGALPVIDVGPLVGGDGDARAVGRRLDRACREVGFFAVTGHGVPDELTGRLVAAGRAFFALPESEKAEIAMARGGRAWRGWFPLGAELTAGVPDHKEGLYFGAELGPDDPGVVAGRPLHGPNLFPRRPAGLRPAVLAYLTAMTALGQALLRGLALGLGLEPAWFARHVTADPVVLLRLFRYAPAPAGSWGVAEHTDYGLLTLLVTDGPGLEVRTPEGWVAVAPVPGTVVCNLGDMLERLTAGRYRSTPHRVVPPAGVDRLSVPFFFDPSFDAAVTPAPGGPRPPDDADRRWDGASVHEGFATYGDYLTAKVARVFPDLAAAVGLRPD